jgi:REP-associated tyrosine transposase
MYAIMFGPDESTRMKQLRLRTFEVSGHRKPGRKPAMRCGRMPHVRRPAHSDRHPLHVTVRVRSGLPTLRSQSMFLRVVDKIRDSCRRFLRVVHFSVQSNHIHLLVEAHDRGRLAQGMKGLAVRVAKGLNDLLGIRGSVWADRYHSRALKTPREVRNALVYVLRNHAKHTGDIAVDRCSSAIYFNGWDVTAACPRERGSPEDWPVIPAETWLLSRGWKKPGGPLRPAELPLGVQPLPADSAKFLV